jgi:hypothetical protein
MTTQLRLDDAIAAVSQKDRVHALLRMAGEAGLCIAEMPLAISYSARNRISDLRREGVVIDGATCRVHKHRAAVRRYVLRGEA